MRELKFRVWDKQNKDWLENSCSLHYFSNWSICPFTGNLIDYVGQLDGDHGEVYSASPAPDYYMAGGKIVKEPRFVIQQYTGLKDKNGKEIYEGDIVERKNAGYLYAVEYSEKEAAYVLRDRDGDSSVYLPDFINNLEIIGNIFENPELLK